MADKIKKFLARLSKRDYELVQALLFDIANGETAHLNIKPLKGHKHVFRVLKGRIRVIFEQQGDLVRILWVGNRDDQTYRDF